ncbi:hypothetical protein L7F22_034283 [Adiantum nelumboides]|nr:hypothetical protein [Adiantum nelumboides]
MTNTQKKNKPHVNEAKDTEEARGKAMAIEKKKLLEEVEVSKIALISFKNVVNTRDDSSDEEGEEKGAEDHGLFTIIENSTLKWDLLDETMRLLEILLDHWLPPFPLCRLMPHPTMRPILDRVDNLALEFARNGYVPHIARFIVSLKTPQMATADVIERVSNNWNPIWMKLNEDFKRQLEDSGWGDVKAKVLYTWDGNHRLRAWNAEINRAHKDDPSYHCCVGASMVDVTEENEGEVLTVVARLNRRKEFIAKEFAVAEYRNAFYIVDKKGQKNTQQAAAIADRSLGEEWWKWAKSLQWTRKIVVVKDWLNLNHSACMYTEEQRVALWPADVYEACPLFLDFSKDTFPSKERVVFQEAKARRITRQQQQGKKLRSLKRKKKEVQEHLEVEDEEDNEEWRPLNSDRETASEFKADEDDDADISDNPPHSPTRSVMTKALQPTQTLTEKMRLAAVERATQARDLDQVVDALQGELADRLNAIEDLQAQVKVLQHEATEHQQLKEKQADEIKNSATTDD